MIFEIFHYAHRVTTHWYFSWHYWYDDMIYADATLDAEKLDITELSYLLRCRHIFIYFSGMLPFSLYVYRSAGCQLLAKRCCMLLQVLAAKVFAAMLAWRCSSASERAPAASCYAGCFFAALAPRFLRFAAFASARPPGASAFALSPLSAISAFRHTPAAGAPGWRSQQRLRQLSLSSLSAMAGRCQRSCAML